MDSIKHRQKANTTLSVKELRMKRGLLLQLQKDNDAKHTHSKYTMDSRGTS